jgi:hypothetical protein
MIASIGSSRTAAADPAVEGWLVSPGLPPACAAACTAAAVGCRLPLLLVGALLAHILLEVVKEALRLVGCRLQHLLRSIVGQIMFLDQHSGALLHDFSDVSRCITTCVRGCSLCPLLLGRFSFKRWDSLAVGSQHQVIVSSSVTEPLLLSSGKCCTLTVTSTVMLFNSLTAAPPLSMMPSFLHDQQLQQRQVCLSLLLPQKVFCFKQKCICMDGVQRSAAAYA